MSAEVEAARQSYKVGDQLRMLVDVWDDGADHHPAGYIAYKDETVIVRSLGGTFPIYVSHEGITDRSFGVNHDEVSLL